MNRSGFRNAVATTGAAIALFALTTQSASALTPILYTNIAPFSADLTYRCKFPLAGEELVQVKLTSDAPTSIEMGVPLEFGISAELEFGDIFSDMLRLIGASSLQGGADVQLLLRVDDQVSTISVPLALAPGDVPGRGERYRGNASGRTESMQLNGEEVSLAAGRALQLNLGVLNADGSPGLPPMDQFTGDCTLDEPETDVLTVNPELIDFYNVVSGTQKSATVHIENGTSKVAHISELTFTGDDSDAFMITGSGLSVCATLAPSQDCSVQVTYVPSELGADSAVFNILSDLGTTQVSVTGTSVLEAAPEFAVTPRELDFGSIEPYETITKEFTVTNMGPGYASFLVAYIPEGDPAFEVQGNGCSTIGAGESCTYSVVFRPDGSEGISRGVLNIAPLNLAATPVSVSLMAESEFLLCSSDVQQLRVAGEAHLPHALSPTPLTGALAGDYFCGDWTGILELDPATARLPVLPLLFPRAGADVQLQFERVGGLGFFSEEAGVALQGQYHIAIPKVSVRVFGFDLVLGGGDQCRTVEPVRLDLSGASFVSGSFVGGFTIGNLENCGSITGLLNRYLTGGDIPVKLQLFPQSM